MTLTNFGTRAYSPEEDNKIFEAINNRPHGVTIQKAVEGILTELNNRDAIGVIARYYYVKNEGKRLQKRLEKQNRPEMFEVLPITVGQVSNALELIQQVNAEVQKLIRERDEYKSNFEASNALVTKLRAKIAELEEDQMAFLKLMAKARKAAESDDAGSVDG